MFLAFDFGVAAFADAAANLSRDNRWSWEGRQYPRGLLDHILISSDLLPFVEVVDLGDSSEASDHRMCSHRVEWPLYNRS